MRDLDVLRDSFKNPGIKFRSAPFWSWNDKLSGKELVRQVKDMKEHGMGGFFMHSREGLETEYMGTEWMDCVKETVKAAKETGMGAWVYDEDRWPSGAAGGLVPAMGGDAFRAKALTIEIIKDEFKDDGKVIALFTAVIDGESIEKCERQRIINGIKPGTGEVLIVLRREVSKACEWFNDDAPADNLNPDSVNAFIKTTYEVYKKEIGHEFGKAIPGIFTDEPNIADGHSIYMDNRGWIPWTDGFDEYFKDKRGYDLLNIVPYIFFTGEKSTKARHDYWRTVSDRFCEAFTEQIGKWCEENGAAFTGHFLLENDMGAATRAGGSVMPHYRYQHVPGIDMLTEQTYENLTVKQCTSVANQYGRKHVLSETYGCTGWDFSFEGQKWVGDWQYVMGVNLRCQHLALYSLKGCRKRDYPPVFNYNTCWWKYNNVVEDYFARIGAVMSHGKVVRDVLVIHPQSTAWSMLGCEVERFHGWRSGIVEEVNLYGEEFNEFIRYLLGMHYDFDLGDETIMEEKGRIEGSKIYVNLAGYKVVVIPPKVKTLLASTVKLLKEFMDKGGSVIAVKPVPHMIEGEESDEIERLFEHEKMIVAGCRDEMVEKLETMSYRMISLKNEYGMEEPGLLCMLRDLPGCQSLFVVNNDREKAYHVNITVNSKGAVEEWDLLTGKMKKVDAWADKNGVSFRAGFGPAGSRLFVIDKTKAPGTKKPGFVPRHVSYGTPREIHGVLGPECRFTRTMPNALILDKCSYRINESGKWSGEADVWQAQGNIRDALGMKQIYYNGLPQRYKWVNKPHINDGTPVELEFKFNVTNVPQNKAYLVLESASDYEIRLNGSEVPVKPDGWFMDRTFDKIPLPAFKEGINKLVLSTKYMNRMEIEDCYIIGDFGVDAKRNIILEPKTIHFGDWCLQGYFHYCGSIIYHFDFNFDSGLGKKAVLELGDHSAVTVEIRVNGEAAGHIPWRPADGVDITKFINNGMNKIDIEVMGSPRNLFGPFHQADDKRPWTDWSSFRREGIDYTPDYAVRPYGLFEQVKIYK